MPRILLAVSLGLFVATLLLACLPWRERARGGRLLLHAGGLAALTAAVLVRYLVTGILPFATTQQFAAVFAWGIAAVGLGLEVRRASSRHVVNALALAVAVALLAWGTIGYQTQAGLVPALQNEPLFVSHVALAAVAYGSFVIAFAAAIGQLLVRREGSRLPLEMQGIAYQAVRIGFPFFTLAILLGSMWADVAWGRFWNWDPKETASLVTWLVYAGYLHVRLSRGWTGRKAAAILVVGFLAVVVTFMGNFVFTGLHSYN